MNKTSKMKWVKLRDTFEELIDYRGLTPKKLKGEWSDKGIRALSALHVKTTGLTNLENIRFVSPELYKRWMRKEVQKGDILLTSEAPAGQVMVWDTDEKIVLSQRLYGIRVNTRYNNYYIKYYLQSEIGQQEIKRNSSGSTVFGISARMFDRIKVPYKKLENQIAIGKTLKALDEKIKVNNKINQELEAMAKTLYDYWFVQFDFPAYLSGTLSGVEGYKSSGGKMVYNEELKREIPEGWTDSTISDWIEHDKSGDWGKAQMEGNYTEKVSCIRGADLNGLNGKGKVKAPERYILEKNNHKILELGDIIIEISGGSPVQSTGRMGFITKETLERFEDPLICSNFCKAVTLKENYMLYNFVYEWNRIYDAGVLFGWEGKTSGIKNFLFEAFVTNYKLVKPSKELMKLFTKQVKPIHSKIQKNLQENQKLAALRDWLLPMLMNGQVKVENGYVAKNEVLGMVAEDGVKYNKTI